MSASAAGPSLDIREIRDEDAAAAARLSGELGYPVDPERMLERIRALAGSITRAVFVACQPDGQVVAWIDIAVTRHLQAEPYVEIGGLVVSDWVRSLGVGRQLVARAEQWALDHGIPSMLVRSRIDRDRAHRFYLREGYRQTKTSAIFSKALVR
jgi:GNAT superfamily N-acetyltransferase